MLSDIFIDFINVDLVVLTLTLIFTACSVYFLSFVQYSYFHYLEAR